MSFPNKYQNVPFRVDLELRHTLYVVQQFQTINIHKERKYLDPISFTLICSVINVNNPIYSPEATPIVCCFALSPISTTQCNTMQYNTIQYNCNFFLNTTQYNTICQYSTIKYNKYITICQYSTIKYNKYITIQYNTITYTAIY